MSQPSRSNRNESSIFQVPTILHDVQHTTSDNHSIIININGIDANTRSSSSRTFWPRVLSIGPLQAFLDRKDTLNSYDTNLTTIIENVKTQAHNYILSDHPDSTSQHEFDSFVMQPDPLRSDLNFDSYLQSFYSPSNLIQSYNNDHNTSPGQLPLPILIARDACFLAAFLKLLFLEVCPILKAHKLNKLGNVHLGNDITELQRADSSSTKSRGLELEENLFSPHLIKAILQDILLVQNQIPLAAIRRIVKIDMGFKSDKEAQERLDLYMAALAFRTLPFYKSKVIVFARIKDIKTMEAPHLLDVMHSLMTNGSCQTGDDTPKASSKIGDGIPKDDLYNTQDKVPGVMQLHKSGVRFKGCNGNSRSLEFDTKYGKLTLPRIYIDDGTELFFQNLMAYETNCYRKRKPESGCHDIVSYLHFMDLLIDTPADVDMLVDKDIVRVMFDSNKQVALMFNRLCRRSRCVFTLQYFDTAKSLKHYCKERMRRICIEFYRSHLSRPWLITSLLAGIGLFVMTFLIMWYTIMLYHHEIHAPP